MPIVLSAKKGLKLWKEVCKTSAKHKKVHEKYLKALRAYTEWQRKSL